MRSAPWTVVLLASAVSAQQPYLTPPQPIVDAVTAPPAPSTSVDPTGTYVLLTEREAMPTIAQMSRPYLRLAGRRIDPATHGSRQTAGRRHSMTLLMIGDGAKFKIPLPADANLGGASWSHDGKYFAFTNTTDDEIHLWVGSVESASAKRVPDVVLNATNGSGFRWMPNGRELLCNLWPGGDAPVRAPAPAGPTIQESDGEAAPVRTYQDLLQDAHDEALFEHHMRSQLAVVDPIAGTHRKIGEPGIFTGASPSPDGKRFLVTRIVRPYSLLVTAWSFPKQIEIWHESGRVVRTLASLPLADKVPIGGVLTGPRSVRWNPNAEATLVWAEALDGGDPKAEVENRDRVVELDLAANGQPTEWFRTPYRFRTMTFGEQGEIALAQTYDRDRRWMRIWRVSTKDKSAEPKIWHERMARDSYADPGSPLTRRDDAGFSRLRRAGTDLFLSGAGASPRGDFPFLDRVDFESGRKERLFECGPEEYATVVAVLDDAGDRLLVSRQSKTSPPNLFVVENGASRQLTHFEDPMAKLLEGSTKKLLHYTRDDGVPLSGTLYTPPSWDGKSRLPLLVWAYPREFISTKTAGQVRGSQNRYTRLSGTSPLMMLLAGYAVLDGATMPIVGPKESANDTFVQQLVSSARAAIDASAEEGVANVGRCAIAGHSYGAFMTANLLAHSGLFRAGIARSGAYNRTLTPFGFQNERRTYWEAPEIYFSMSPFMHAPKIDEPILLIHGADDNNSGTFPIQSKRLYHAIKGNGGRARLVFLPHESHGYRAKESVLHVLAESVAWLDEHVKNAKPEVVPAAHDGK